ncbi:cobyrinic acid a,c-diamide synthase [Halorubellus sp. PRR65]|uniref:cobyrinic acid a,c-diamide synthase n=1 Tax=Halorubellus sp. PRR65 TaxID=3098148 RepID=UPI002B257AFC|nr:cobyrinic acid a,c-diamide synthase [Halorubellus sp. PRR65]
MNGVVLGGTRSGVGKTVATLAVVHALQRDGATVQPAKAGPDFVDPSHHAQVAERPSRTLDAWLQGDDGLRRNYHRGDGDVCVVEGVMGLYDGDCSSTAAVASALDLPVVLVVDAKAGMESVAATALGFRRYAEHAGAGEDVDVAGVLAQRAHGGRHEAGIRDALPDDLAYLGRIPPLESLEIPDRHLGLHMGDESPLDGDALDDAAEHVRVDRIRDLARAPPRPDAEPPAGASTAPTDATVAVARDDAFRFAYPATIERLRERATVEPFAPTAGDDLPACDAVYLPGGYPELHADALAASPALDQLAAAAADGRPVLGECGGLMALSRSLATTDGDVHEMAGVLPADVRMCDRYQALDHVELRARDRTLTADVGETRRGHEFHYSTADVDDDARFAFDVDRGTGIHDQQDGLTEYRTLGTYCHLHADSGAFDAFLDHL